MNVRSVRLWRHCWTADDSID